MAAINLDLLKKLTRLANHNPNKHEANAAARRVCQMLEGADFSLGQAQAQPSAQPRSSYSDLYEMVMEQIRKQEQKEKEERARTASDTFKQQQAQSRPKPEEPKYKPHPAQEEFFKSGRYEPHMPFDEVDGKRKPRRPNPRAAKDFWGQGQGPGPSYEYVVYDEMADPPKVKSLECTVCHKVKETFYVGNLYVCGDCQATEYKRKEKP